LIAQGIISRRNFEAFTNFENKMVKGNPYLLWANITFFLAGTYLQCDKYYMWTNITLLWTDTYTQCGKYYTWTNITFLWSNTFT